MLLVCRNLSAATLQPQTVKAWQQYVRLTEMRISTELESEKGFLVLDFLPPSDASDARQTIHSGGIFVREMKTRNEEGGKVRIPKGMVHHWMGSILIRGVELDEVLSCVQDYARFAEYFEEVDVSRLLSRDDDVFRVLLKLNRKKIRTVHFNTEHVVQFRHHDPMRASSKTEAIKIAQLVNPDTPKERERPQGQDSGYLWRLNTYWRFKQVDVGVIVDCETLSLSRTIPAPLRWLIDRFTRSVPKQTLESTLDSVRTALTSL
jgi:hypothetical protein